MIKNKKKATPKLTDEQVAADAKRFFSKAIDSRKFCVFIGYQENDTFNFSEHRTAMSIGDLYAMQKDVEAVVRKASLPAQRSRRK